MSKASLPALLLKGEFTPELKQSRITIGSFGVVGFEVVDGKVNVKLGSFAMNNADIPLDYRFEMEENIEPLAAPLTVQNFGMTKLYSKQDGVDGFTRFIFNRRHHYANKYYGSTQCMDETLFSPCQLTTQRPALEKQKCFSMDRLSGTMGKANTEDTYTSSSSMEGLVVNLKAIPDPSTQQIAAQLGYDKIEASAKGVGNLQSGTRANYD